MGEVCALTFKQIFGDKYDAVCVFILLMMFLVCRDSVETTPIMFVVMGVLFAEFKSSHPYLGGAFAVGPLHCFNAAQLPGEICINVSFPSYFDSESECSPFETKII